MTNYEIRVTQLTRDYYRLEANSPEEAEKLLWTALRTGIMGNIERNDTHDDVPIRSPEHVHLRQVSTTNHKNFQFWPLDDRVRRRDSRLPFMALLQYPLNADFALRRMGRRDFDQSLALRSYSFLRRPLLAARRRDTALFHPLLVAHDLAPARRGLVREAPLAALHVLPCRGGGVLGRGA